MLVSPASMNERTAVAGRNPSAHIAKPPRIPSITAFSAWYRTTELAANSLPTPSAPKTSDPKTSMLPIYPGAPGTKKVSVKRANPVRTIAKGNSAPRLRSRK